MPDAVPEPTVWEALRLDLVPDGGSPEALAPVDAEFVRGLIVAAQSRLERWIGHALADFDALPPELGQALIVDVGANYFSRLNPELPAAYFDLIASHRVWGFGGSGDS
ncbi:hypothetical protein NKH74_10690 [Mesorhizobium sp. M0933]|uniref:hypothetical protein n=1 Tax=Mesorhizobium sp. M0933 TaxID=2957030 RepID=UPI00333C4969